MKAEFESDNVPTLLEALMATPACIAIPEGPHPSADFLYNNHLVIEHKAISVKLSDKREKLYHEIRSAAGLLPNVRGLSMAQMAEHTSKPTYWKKRVENQLFRGLEGPIRKAKEQIRNSRTAYNAPYGVVMLDITGDHATRPEDLGILIAKMIKRYTDRNDVAMYSVSAICSFYRDRFYVDRAGNTGFVLSFINTEYGMQAKGFEIYLNALFEDLGTHAGYDISYVSS